jgi:uncharacterized protein (DUF1697 family)
MKYVAFLRGINVGGRIIKMTDLKACFEAMGFQNVATVLQTGNVLFEALEPDVSVLKQHIERALGSSFDYPAKVQVYTVDDLAKVLADCPFTGGDANYHSYVLFLEGNLASALAAEAKDIGPDEKVELGNKVVYWRVKKGMTLKSPFAKHLTKAKYRDFNTNRNTNTLRKILK